MPSVIVTRAEPGATETAARLAAAGYEPIVSPVQVLEAVSPWPAIPFATAGGIIFTSPNAARIVAGREMARALPVWVVGAASAQAARAAGWSDVRAGDGDGAALAAMILASGSPGAGPLLHLANAAAGTRLTDRLEAGGVAAATHIVYGPREAGALSRAARGAIAAGRACAVLLHSTLGARAFARLSAGLDVSRLVAVAMSADVLDGLSDLPLGARIAAPAPNEAAMLAALKAACPATKA